MIGLRGGGIIGRLQGGEPVGVVSVIASESVRGEDSGEIGTRC